MHQQHFVVSGVAPQHNKVLHCGVATTTNNNNTRPHNNNTKVCNTRWRLSMAGFDCGFIKHIGGIVNNQLANHVHNVWPPQQHPVFHHLNTTTTTQSMLQLPHNKWLFEEHTHGHKHHGSGCSVAATQHTQNTTHTMQHLSKVAATPQHNQCIGVCWCGVPTGHAIHQPPQVHLWHTPHHYHHVDQP